MHGWTLTRLMVIWFSISVWSITSHHNCQDLLEMSCKESLLHGGVKCIQYSRNIKMDEYSQWFSSQHVWNRRSQLTVLHVIIWWSWRIFESAFRWGARWLFGLDGSYPRRHTPKHFYRSCLEHYTARPPPQFQCHSSPAWKLQILHKWTKKTSLMKSSCMERTSSFLSIPYFQGHWIKSRKME